MSQMSIKVSKDQDGKIEIDPVSHGGRPLQTMLNDKKRAMIHERVMELITVVQQKVFPTTTPGKAISLFKLGEGQPPLQGIKTMDLVDGRVALSLYVDRGKWELP